MQRENTVDSVFEKKSRAVIQRSGFNAQ